MYIPDKGDIVTLDFDPSAGKEIMKRRPAFIISRKIFNEHTGFAITAPITSTPRKMKLEIILPEELQTEGSILVHQVKSLDYSERNVKLIEKVSEELSEEVTKMVMIIIK